MGQTNNIPKIQCLTDLMPYVTKEFDVNLEEKTITIDGSVVYPVEKVEHISNTFPGAGYMRVYKDDIIRLYHCRDKTLRCYIEPSMISDSFNYIVSSLILKEKRD
jgi:hypothetical protein